MDYLFMITRNQIIIYDHRQLVKHLNNHVGNTLDNNNYGQHYEWLVNFWRNHWIACGQYSLYDILNPCQPRVMPPLWRFFHYCFGAICNRAEFLYDWPPFKPDIINFFFSGQVKPLTHNVISKHPQSQNVFPTLPMTGKLSKKDETYRK